MTATILTEDDRSLSPPANPVDILTEVGKAVESSVADQFIAERTIGETPWVADERAMSPRIGAAWGADEGAKSPRIGAAWVADEGAMSPRFGAAWVADEGAMSPRFGAAWVADERAMSPSWPYRRNSVFSFDVEPLAVADEKEMDLSLIESGLDECKEEVEEIFLSLQSAMRRFDSLQTDFDKATLLREQFYRELSEDPLLSHCNEGFSACLTTDVVHPSVRTNNRFHVLGTKGKNE